MVALLYGIYASLLSAVSAALRTSRFALLLRSFGVLQQREVTDTRTPQKKNNLELQHFIHLAIYRRTHMLLERSLFFAVYIEVYSPLSRRLL